jgi:hypothetical protein
MYNENIKLTSIQNVQQQRNARKRKQKPRRAKRKFSAGKLSRLTMIVNSVFRILGLMSFKQQDLGKQRRFGREFGRMNLMLLEVK